MAASPAPRLRRARDADCSACSALCFSSLGLLPNALPAPSFVPFDRSSHPYRSLRFFRSLLLRVLSSAALDQMTRSLAVALAPYRIRVNAVAFGSVMSASLKDTLREHGTALAGSGCGYAYHHMLSQAYFLWPERTWSGASMLPERRLPCTGALQSARTSRSSIILIKILHQKCVGHYEKRTPMLCYARTDG